MEQNINKNIPVIFQNIKHYSNEDERFVKVKIWLMHTGENLNGSVFTKEAVERALPTLANTPILAFIEENSAGEIDYSDHRMVLHRDGEGEFSIKYLGQAVGIIPETNNAKWEIRVTDSGEELEYLTVEGLMWTKWNDPIDIITRKGVTAQSMELADNFTGHFNKDKLFEFESFSFFGACLLGNDVTPAMRNSTVETQFSTNSDMRKIIENKLSEFNTLFSMEQGGINQMEETKQEEVVVDETTVEEEVVETQTEVVETPQVDESFEQTESDTPNDVEEEVKDVKKDEDVEPSTTEEVNDEVTVVEEEVDTTNYQSMYEDLKGNFDLLNDELNELKEFKRKTLESELASQFEGQLTNEDINGVFENSKSIELVDIEKELYALVGKKNFSVIKETQPTKIAVQVQQVVDVMDEPYGGLFEKFAKKKSTDK